MNGAVVFGLIALALAILAGVTFNDNRNGSVVVGSALALIAFFCLTVGGTFLQKTTKGTIAIDNGSTRLTNGAIYKTLSVASVDGKTVAVLQTQDGKLLAYELIEKPPKVFAKTKDKENPYASLSDKK